MTHILLLLFCLGCSLVESSHFPLRRYYYVDINKNWYDARTYCQEHYSDLAMFSSVEEAALAVKPVGFSSSYAWIGIVDEVQDWKGFMTNKSNSWKWSATGKGSTTGYQNFNLPTEPSYGLGLEQCVKINPVGKWRDAKCADLRHFVCFTETDSGPSYTYKTFWYSWFDALAYCRQHHTDLAVIENNATNFIIINLELTQEAWIGLSRVPWTWVDGSPLTYNNWVGGAPQLLGAQPCVTEDSTHQWKAAGCANTYPFLCHEDLFPKTTVTLNMQSSANLSDLNITLQILQQLEAEMRTTGYTAVKIKWAMTPLKKK